MFPGIDGFHWTAGHLTFLGTFFLVLSVVFWTVAGAAARAVRSFRGRRLEAIRWHSDFQHLAERDRACRHAINGELRGRVCDQGFDCRKCKVHRKLLELLAPRPEPAGAAEVLGIPVHADRYYHRGHAWARPEADGTITVGLDGLASRVLGRAEEILPKKGDRLHVNETGWRMRRKGLEVRILAPVEGTVTETGGAEAGWFLKIKPFHEPADLRHLLRGREARNWFARELDRLHTLAPAAAGGATMADGGVLVDDLAECLDTADWQDVASGMLLQP